MLIHAHSTPLVRGVGLGLKLVPLKRTWAFLPSPQSLRNRTGQAWCLPSLRQNGSNLLGQAESPTMLSDAQSRREGAWSPH